MSQVTLGWAEAYLGRSDEGIVLNTLGLATLVRMGARLTVPLSLILMAESQKLDNLIDEALATVEEAFQANPDESTFRPEILVVRGELQAPARAGRAC